LHTAFNFDFLRIPWDVDAQRKTIDDSIDAVASVGAPATWVLSNHDVVRHVSRLGRPFTPAAFQLVDLPPFETLDREELGLWEVEDLPEDVLRDPTWVRSGHTDRGRDGSRVPLPWSGTAPPFGFSPEGASAPPWLPQLSGFATVTVQAEDRDPDSMLWLYRRALALRREHAALGDGEPTWLPSPQGVLAFSRGLDFSCWVNLSSTPVPLPLGAQVLVAPPLRKCSATSAPTSLSTRACAYRCRVTRSAQTAW
jgi:alpha-glucosidase